MKRYRERVKAPTKKNPELIEVGKKQSIPQTVKEGNVGQKRMKDALANKPKPNKSKTPPSKGK